MDKKQILSPEVLRQLLRYDPETGRLYWRHRQPVWFSEGGRTSADHAASAWNKKYAGAEAFTHDSARGYFKGRVLDVNISAHQAAWVIQTGAWPEHEVDHINGDKHDNRWANLRAATRQQNQFNRAARKDNTSGAKGVYFDKRSGKWAAQIRHNGKRLNLGLHADVASAAKAYEEASKVLHGEFARHS